MKIQFNNQEYEFPDYTLTEFDIKKIERKYLHKEENEIFDEILKDLDCTKELLCGRPMMTTYPMYAYVINSYLYLLNKVQTNNEENLFGVKFDANDWIEKLIQRHQDNITFEKEHPYKEIVPLNKNKTKNKRIVSYKTKDLFTGEDSYLIEDTKTRKRIVNKNPDCLTKHVVPLSAMKFNFKKQ